MNRLPPVEAVAAGLAAAVVGTGFMTAWQELAAKLKAASQDGRFPAPQEPPQDPWEAASAPAKVAKRIGEGVFHKAVSPQLMPLLTNGMHWGYGAAWGTVYGLAAGSSRSAPGLTAGAAFGTIVWLISYVQLVPMALYDPPWKTPPQELALDLSYHLVYGTSVASAFRLLNPSRRIATSSASYAPRATATSTPNPEAPERPRKLIHAWAL